jgi:ABC-type multidrug transport system fused ATPase/permease subunit
MESTVRENITVADAKADTPAVMAAARTAGIMPLIEALPEGLDHWIGAQGANFSGGQRQRLGLARAILRRPQVLILDEATSALDALMEDSILAGLDGSRPGQTTILITHRLTAVLDVDHLIVLEDGVVVESGAPRQLLTRPEGRFKAMLAPFEAETRMLDA